MSADPWAGSSTPITGPCERHVAITPGAGDLDPRPRAIFCGGAGDVTITDQAGVSVTYAVQAGQILPFRAVKVTAATASGLVGWV